MARRHTEVFLELLKGEGFAQPNPRPMFPIRPACCDWSRTHPGCGIESGGGRARAPGGLRRSYAAEPDQLVAQLRDDTAIAAADTLLLTVPNQLGLDYNAQAIEAILRYVAPELGWR